MTHTSRLEHCFAALKQQNRPALVSYLTAGDPDAETSRRLLHGLPKAGVDIIELGMPFSDPMADGPAIQKAALRALNNGQTQAKTLEMVRRFREEDSTTPIVLMGYYNPIYCYGVERFLTDAAKAGVDGLIVVDLPPEHDEELCQPAAQHNIDFIRLATPTTDAKRLPKVLANASGFIYYVSVAGVTGGSAPTPERLEGAVAGLREHTELPIAVGFGIRTAEQAATIGRFSDAVVVGSALVDCIENANTPDEAVERVHGLVSELAESVRACREVIEPQVC
ncbi:MULTISPECIES: tryptophan synthase subunit alpha [Halomonadaceae]|uniref:Tryptophan synthase alpha chain n=1 Tax=Vreelandella titanicae TaxID=664683 RepID=A0A653VBD6_9GAMM|nr:MULTISPECIES: tryptophan synthase subunit alpha [Halomonas]UEQ02685.1 tryptophan synthase subunit alpha [Halomonas profundus]QKS24461.1 Tryptophan synthase alpha chain [Halomonas titanicae]TMU17645.1 tryptophan synthase subunit alpha [Halomonas sp. ATBC28]CAD5250870.1 Tryptophan synthase alpha chain [Halomonas sp. 113]CAD5250904.1 Tryptophan synthase alpha chain [Halomonas sp. 59]